MEKKSSEKTKPNTRKVGFKVNISRNEWAPLTEDLNGCVLVIPESFAMYEHITHKQGKLLQYPL